MTTKFERMGKKTQKQLEHMLPPPIFKKLIKPLAKIKMAPRLKANV